ncbi:hypothetical protein RB3062 [Rhodopirellula baltica SH 1]|uniref:Uncharacterized protein n=1 Tax=Rhodopirellula baltica (strain DSM 10527 / NCIMB 13988 / SH1) TaxID=243090 RepID=Q7UUU0_RHOBA|nr:hypothetical protein RB3062 [Rhodopirellula baltica SH 1]
MLFSSVQVEFVRLMNWCSSLLQRKYWPRVCSLPNTFTTRFANIRCIDCRSLFDALFSADPSQRDSRRIIRPESSERRSLADCWTDRLHQPNKD